MKNYDKKSFSSTINWLAVIIMGLILVSCNMPVEPADDSPANNPPKGEKTEQQLIAEEQAEFNAILKSNDLSSEDVSSNVMRSKIGDKVQLIIEADKSSFVADGKEKVKFSAKLNILNKFEVPLKLFRVYVEQDGEFKLLRFRRKYLTTRTPGEHRIKAKFWIFESNIVTVTAEKDSYVLITLGDSLTNGDQDGSVNEATQSNGFPEFLNAQFAEKYNTTWTNPYVDNTNELRVDPTIIPYNLAIDGATVQSMINMTSNSGYNLLDQIFTPIPEKVGADVTQLEAAEYVASLHKGEKKIITLLIGNNEILGAVTAGGGTELSMDELNAFINNEEYGHDLVAVCAGITTILDRLSKIDNSEIFIGTLPSISNIGALINASDLESMAQFENPEVTALPEGYSIGFYTAFYDLEALTSNKFAAGPVAQALTEVSNNTELNGVLEMLLAPELDSLVLSPEEAAVLECRIEAVNAYIWLQSALYDNVTVVDTNKFFNNVINGKVVVGGNTITKSLGGGMFSLDGAHPSTTGYALIANEYIKQMNKSLKLGLDQVDTASVLENDSYFDNDGDGFIMGPLDPANVNFISAHLLNIADVNDSDPTVAAPVVSGTELPVTDVPVF